jgi:hypothetical protein
MQPIYSVCTQKSDYKSEVFHLLHKFSCEYFKDWTWLNNWKENWTNCQKLEGFQCNEIFSKNSQSLRSKKIKLQKLTLWKSHSKSHHHQLNIRIALSFVNSLYFLNRCSHKEKLHEVVFWKIRETIKHI